MTAQPAEEPRGFVPRSEHYATLRRLDAMTAERDELRATVNSMIGAHRVIDFMKAGFPKCESQLLACMWDRDVQPSETLIVAYYPDRSDELPDVNNLIKVRICSVRKRMRAFGGPPDAIRTLFGCGYGLTDKGRQWLSQRVYGASK